MTQSPEMIAAGNAWVAARRNEASGRRLHMTLLQDEMFKAGHAWAGAALAQAAAERDAPDTAECGTAQLAAQHALAALRFRTQRAWSAFTRSLGADRGYPTPTYAAQGQHASGAMVAAGFAWARAVDAAERGGDAPGLADQEHLLSVFKASVMRCRGGERCQ